MIQAARDLFAGAGSTDLQQSAFLSARLHTRELCLSHLASAAALPPGDTGFPPYPPIDARSIAFSVDLVLWKIRNHTRRQDLDSAFKELSSLATSNFASTLGKAQTTKLELAHGVMLRFQGRFPEAYELLIRLPATNSKVLSHLSAVMCEMGQYDRAITKLEGWLQVSIHPHSRASRRIKLGLANAWLVKSLISSLSSQQQDGHAMYFTGFETADRLYGDIQGCKELDWLEILSISVGCAIVKHIRLQVEPAIDAWRHVRLVSRKYALPVGYTDMVSAYALSDLEFRRGGITESDIYARQAKEIFSGRQYHFTGLGTIWLDMLMQWFSANGRGSYAVT